MMRVLPVLLLLGLVVYALVDCLQTPSRDVRSASKPLWLAVIVLVPVVGAAGWLLLGRRRPTGRAGSRRRPLAPDDDPDFLRSLRGEQPPPPRPPGEDEPGDASRA